MRALIPLVALVVGRPEGGGCQPPPRADGRIGVAGHAPHDRVGVVVDAIGVGTPADGAVEPGERILSVDGRPLGGGWAFQDLREGARGVPGTAVELVVRGDHGTRTVRLERARFEDDVVRREGRMPDRDDIVALMRAAGVHGCVQARSAYVAGSMRRGAVEVHAVDRVDGPTRACLLDALRAAEAPVHLHGDFVWRQDVQFRGHVLHTDWDIEAFPPGPVR